MKRIFSFFLFFFIHVNLFAWSANWQPPTNKIFRVDDPAYGAIPDDGLSDSAAIVAARNAAIAAGGGTILFTEHGIYDETFSINVTGDNLTFEGEGSGATLRCHSSSNQTGGLLSATARNNITVRNITFDGNIENRQAATNVLSGIGFTACKNVLIDRCYFKDLGLYSSPASTNCVTIYVAETSTQDSDGVTIRYCRFEDKLGRIKFGIRATTEWADPKDELVRHNKNIIIHDCAFLYGFTWNANENAGHGTYNVTVTDCVAVDNIKYSPFEADKGAHDVSFLRCRVYNLNDPDNTAWAFNVSGQPSDGDPGFPHPERRAHDVTFTDCEANGVIAGANGGMGYRIVLSDNVTITRPILKNINTDSNHRAFYTQECTGVTIDGADVTNCYYLYVHVNNMDISDFIYKNGTSSTTLGFHIGQSLGTKSNITVLNNTITVSDMSVIGAIDTENVTGLLISGNTIAKATGAVGGDKAAIVVDGSSSNGSVINNSTTNFNATTSINSAYVTSSGNTP